MRMFREKKIIIFANFLSSPSLGEQLVCGLLARLCSLFLTDCDMTDVNNNNPMAGVVNDDGHEKCADCPQHSKAPNTAVVLLYPVSSTQCWGHTQLWGWN